MASVTSSTSSSSYSSSSSSDDGEIKRPKKSLHQEKVQPLKKAMTELKSDGMRINLPKTGIPNEEITLIGNAKLNCEMHVYESAAPLREKTYRKENPKEMKKIAVTILKKDIVENTKIMATSMLIGGLVLPVVGLAVGFIVGGIRIKKNVTKKMQIMILTSNHYLQWRSSSISKKVYPIFKNFLDAEKVFKDFICPLSKDIIFIPMRGPDKVTYEKDFIHAYLEEKTKSDKPNAYFKSPVTSKTFCKNDLVFDLDYCRRLIQKTREVYQLIMTHKSRIEIKYGVEAIEKNTIETISNLHTQVKIYYYDLYEKKVDSGTMTHEQRHNLIKKKTAQWDWGLDK